MTIPNSVTSIGDESFSYCIGLTSITISESVTSIGNSVFEGCASLEEIIVSVDNPVYSSLDGVLYNKDQTELLKWPGNKLCVTIPESVTNIGDGAFSSCSGLTSVTIPNSVERIGDRAFYVCSRLTSVTIGDSVESIGNRAFCWCKSLATIVIGKSVSSIGTEAFAACSSLTTITLPESVTNIGIMAFADCGSLTTVTIPESVTSIGNYAFTNCNQLESVTVHAVTPPEIESGTFDNYDMPLYVSAGCKEAYQAADYWCNFMNIQELATSVETVLDNGARIYVENHTLHVESVEGDYRVYTTTGQLVYAGHAATVQLADAGVYVVRTSSRSQKVVVK